MSVMPTSPRPSAHGRCRSLILAIGSTFVTSFALIVAGCGGEKVVDASGGPSTTSAEVTKGEAAKKSNMPKGIMAPKGTNTQ